MKSIRCYKEKESEVKDIFYFLYSDFCKYKCLCSDLVNINKPRIYVHKTLKKK